MNFYIYFILEFLHLFYSNKKQKEQEKRKRADPSTFAPIRIRFDDRWLSESQPGLIQKTNKQT